MTNLSLEDLLRLLTSFLLITLVTFGVAIGVIQAGFIEIATIMAAIAGILSAIFAFYTILNTSEKQPDKTTQTQQPTQNYTTPPPPGKPPEELTKEERVQRMEADDNWNQKRRPILSSRTRKIIRWLTQKTPIQLRHIEIFLYSLAVIGLLLSIPFLLQFLSIFIILPSWLESIPLLVPIEIEPFASFFPFSFLFMLIFPASWYYGTRQMTECPECGAPFSMNYKKSYWRGENERTTTQTDNEDNPYTVTKYRGKMVHECENCGYINIEPDRWQKDERDLGSKFF